jgi:hypothetical protein
MPSTPLSYRPTYADVTVRVLKQRSRNSVRVPEHESQVGCSSHTSTTFGFSVHEPMCNRELRDANESQRRRWHKCSQEMLPRLRCSTLTQLSRRVAKSLSTFASAKMPAPAATMPSGHKACVLKDPGIVSSFFSSSFVTAAFADSAAFLALAAKGFEGISRAARSVGVSSSVTKACTRQVDCPPTFGSRKPHEAPRGDRHAITSPNCLLHAVADEPWSSLDLAGGRGSPAPSQLA